MTKTVDKKLLVKETKEQKPNDKNCRHKFLAKESKEAKRSD